MKTHIAILLISLCLIFGANTVINRMSETAFNKTWVRFPAFLIGSGSIIVALVAGMLILGELI